MTPFVTPAERNRLVNVWEGIPDGWRQVRTLVEIAPDTPTLTQTCEDCGAQVSADVPELHECLPSGVERDGDGWVLRKGNPLPDGWRPLREGFFAVGQKSSVDMPVRPVSPTPAGSDRELIGRHDNTPDQSRADAPHGQWTVDYDVALDRARLYCNGEEIGLSAVARILNARPAPLPTAEQVCDRANISYRDAEAALEAVAHSLSARTEEADRG